MLPARFEPARIEGRTSALRRFVRFSVERKRHLLYRCATGDESFTAQPCDGDARFAALEPKADALVRISALVALGAPEALCQEHDRARIRSGCVRRRHRRNVDQRRDDHWSRPSRLCSACNRARHRIRHRRCPPELTGRRTSSESDDGASNRTARNIQCAGRQLRHAGRSCAQMIGSTRRWRVGGEHRRERATRRHRPTATYRTATADRRCHAAERAATRRSEAFV